MPPTTLMRDSETDDDIVMPDKAQFKIFSSALKAIEKDIDGVTRKFLVCTASSTVKDLHGDYMTADCVQGMAPQAKQKGMTIFLNHSYKVPEDVFGKTTDSRIVQRSHDANGDPVWDLDLEVMLNESNDRAISTYAAIKDQGMKMGVSIGAMIEDYAFIDEEAGFWGGLEIKSVNLLEASIVGIPANQRSWVVNGLEALGAPKAIIRKAAGLSEKPVNKESNPPTPAPEPPAPPPAPEPPVPDAAKGGTPTDVEAPAAPAQETPEGGADSSTDTDAPAAEETPSVEAAADAVANLKSAGADNAMLEILLGFLEGATEEVASLRKDLGEATKERDQARQDVQRAAEAVELLAKTPIGRKAHFAGPVSTFRARFAGYYDEGFLKLLDQAGEDDNE